jgi:type I restriction enzyme R subunit
MFNPEDTIESGEVDNTREYTLSDFNNKIYLPEREERMVEIMLEQINPNQKTIVFCNDEKHAAMIRDAVNKFKPTGTLGDHHNYCVRITSSEGEIGDQFLREFRDNEKNIPTIVTTSRKLSTGVDARNVRFVVLMRNVGSMIEFKQIVGRGTRVYDGKDYFTIVDFYGNDAKFQDAEWDGEPAEVEEANVTVCKYPIPDENEGIEIDGGTGIIKDPGENPYGGSIIYEPPKQKTVVRLSDGKVREIKYSVDTQFYMDGKAVTPSEFMEKMFGEFPEFFNSEDELRSKWSDPRTRAALLQGLADRGFEEAKLQALKELVDAPDSDIYDVLRYIAYAKETMTRAERADLVREYYLEQLDDNEKEFVLFILDTYEKAGEKELSMDNLTRLIELKYRTTNEGMSILGEAQEIVNDYLELQKEIYEVG